MTQWVIHIDKLVLRGVDRGDMQLLSTAIQDELLRLLATPVPTTVERASAPLRIPFGADVTSLGRSVAGRIAKEVRR